jgi:predicted transcriptional regulator
MMDRAAWIAMPSVTTASRLRHEALLDSLRRDPRQAVEEEHIVCLICAVRFRQLTNTHLRAHQLTAADYKARFGYNRRRPLMCRSLARLYAERAVRIGLADQIRSRPIVVEPALRRRGGMRPVTLEELLTRRDARRAAAGGVP